MVRNRNPFTMLRGLASMVQKPCELLMANTSLIQARASGSVAAGQAGGGAREQAAVTSAPPLHTLCSAARTVPGSPAGSRASRQPCARRTPPSRPPVHLPLPPPARTLPRCGARQELERARFDALLSFQLPFGGDSCGCVLAHRLRAPLVTMHSVPFLTAPRGVPQVCVCVRLQMSGRGGGGGSLRVCLSAAASA